MMLYFTSLLLSGLLFRLNRGAVEQLVPSLLHGDVETRGPRGLRAAPGAPQHPSEAPHGVVG